jgi:hypothetical protein
LIEGMMIKESVVLEGALRGVGGGGKDWEELA